MVIVRATCLLLLFLLLASPSTLTAEELTAKEIVDMSFDDLLGQTIYSASKAEEKLFEAPLSATVLRRDEILAAGSTSIPEALRLVPGVIVREQTNGNYDVHLRGFDYLPVASISNNLINNLTLVMIDNRIVFNYLTGGTFWETLPVDIHDVDRIEVIRGPVSALYGPNAVTGVIHIITRSPEREGSHSDAHIEGGRHRTGIARASTQHRWSNGYSYRLSANGQTRERNEVEYYNYSKGEFSSDLSEFSFLTNPRPLDNLGERYPNEERSLHKGGINLFVEGNIKEDITFDVDMGFQESSVKRVAEDIEATPLTTSETSSQYFNLNARGRNTTVQLAITDGETDTAGAPAFNFDYTTYDMAADYRTTLSGISLQPGIAYRKVEYSGGNRFEEGDPELDLYSGNLRAESKIGDLTLVGAVRADQYDTRSKIFPSYQAVIGYQPNETHSFRTHYGRAFRSPFMQDTFEVITFPVSDGVQIQGRGNEDLDLLTNDTVELGWRAHLTDEVESDLELFWSRNKDYQDIFPDGTVENNNGISTIVIPFQQIDLEAEQFGGTLSLYYGCDQLRARVFGTVQKTHLHNNLIDQTDPTSLANGDHDNTPDYYGGFYVNWAPYSRWNFNLSSYFFGSSKQFSRSALLTTGQSSRVSGKWIVNSKVSYMLGDGAKIFVNARNLLNNDSREYSHTDRIDALYLTGIELTL